jgi:putative molybdopterin biosynthesis protein
VPAPKTAKPVAARLPGSGHLGIHLRYSLGPGEQGGASLENPLFELIAALVAGGSIRHAAELLGASYRHVWDSVRKWERLLGEPLVTWSQGKRARPTQFAHRLLWAERRARTRMQPHIEALRSDLEHVIADARDERQLLLTMSASHDLAVSLLQRHMAEHADLHLAVTFSGSVDSLRSLNEGQCLVAGFHVPVVTHPTSVFARALKPLLAPNDHSLIACSRRTQGLMVRKEDAHRVRTFADVHALRLRFVNRQAGSGTRMLVDHLRNEHSIKPKGFADHVEQTHVAVGLCVASGVADAGVGIEAAALQFGLHFVPLIEERYFLACRTESLEHAAVQRMREILAGRQWAQILTRLAGYHTEVEPGEVLGVEGTLPWWGKG